VTGYDGTGQDECIYRWDLIVLRPCGCQATKDDPDFLEFVESTKPA
jgi:hypothetical protein